MRNVLFGFLIVSVLALASATALAQQKAPFPEGWKTWTHVTSTIVTDKKHPAFGIRHIYVNDKGKATALSGGKAFPDGSAFILVFYDILNTQVPHPKGGKSPKMVMGKRTKLDLMVKDSSRYAETGGWNYARFLLPEMKFVGKFPYRKVCFGCHSRVKALDFVFTRTPK